MNEHPTVSLLKAYLERTGIKQKHLAILLDVSPSTFNRWLKGKHKVSKAYREYIYKRMKNIC